MIETEPKPKRSRKAEAGRRNLVKFRETNPAPATKAGIYTVTRSDGQELPAIPGAAEIRAVDGRIAQFIQDLGGPENVTAAQQIVLDGIRTSLLVQGLCEAFLTETGVVDRRRKPHALLKSLATFINSSRLGALALGLERKARDAKTLDARLAEIAEREAEEAETDNDNGPENTATEEN